MNCSLGRAAENGRTRRLLQSNNTRVWRRLRLPPEQQQIQIPSGLVVVTTYGVITQQTAQALMEMRSFSEQQGMKNVRYQMIPGTLVEKARNEAVRMMLREGHGWMLFVDGDMIFAPDSLHRLLITAFGEMPFVDVLGAYCPLRGDLRLPPIDRCTGTA